MHHTDAQRHRTHFEDPEALPQPRNGRPPQLRNRLRQALEPTVVGVAFTKGGVAWLSREGSRHCFQQPLGLHNQTQGHREVRSPQGDAERIDVQPREDTPARSSIGRNFELNSTSPGMHQETCAGRRRRWRPEVGHLADVRRATLRHREMRNHHLASRVRCRGMTPERDEHTIIFSARHIQQNLANAYPRAQNGNGRQCRHPLVSS
mmetsp:Transcript_75363/g.245109  ORF Transcript_75363/g.245109 Transcript_75363/m.245109 type:complete len:206 (+) Transcript_75363:2140-2757(+)